MTKHYPCDLHVHSNWSDGDYAPPRVFREARKAGMRAIVLTEHDVTKGLDGTYQALAKRHHIQTLQGVEISTKHKGMEVHILGYAHLFNLPKLQKGLTATLAGMAQRAQLMVKKLRAIGITQLTYQDIKRQLPKGIIVVKYHISQAIARERSIPIEEVRTFMHGGGSAEVPISTASWTMSPVSAVQLIHAAGGIAVLAHPGNYRGFNRFPNDKLEQLIDELIPQLARTGLDGLETRTAKHTPAQLKKYHMLAQRYHLIETGGSDWHGYIKSPDRNLGDGGITHREFKTVQKRFSA